MAPLMDRTGVTGGIDVSAIRTCYWRALASSPSRSMQPSMLRHPFKKPPPMPAAQILAFRNRNAFEMTDAELRLIANAAIIGDSSHPVNGYNTPAAKGTPSAL
jgi:hypothetical protein